MRMLERIQVLVVGMDAHTLMELLQLEENRQFNSISAKFPGKANAEQIIDFKSKLTSQKVAASHCIDKVYKAIVGLRKDISSGHKTGGSLTRGHTDSIEKLKGLAIEAADAIVATVLNIKEAMECFKEKRGTNNYQMPIIVYRRQIRQKTKCPVRSGSCISR